MNGWTVNEGGGAGNEWHGGRCLIVIKRSKQITGVGAAANLPPVSGIIERV